MKFNFSLIFLFCISIAHSQNLKNTEWVKISAEKKDGSKIVDKIRRDLIIENYFFKENTVLISERHQYTFEQPYSVNQGVLTIGNFLRYTIDTVNDVVLELTEFPKTPISDNQLNTYAFIKSKYLFEYLKENNQLKITGDSLIQCTKQFCPTYAKGDLPELLRRPFESRKDSVNISGYFVVDQNNKITEVSLNPSQTFNRTEASYFITALKMTGKSWILTITDKQYAYKIDFSCFFHTLQTLIKGGNNPRGYKGQFYTAEINLCGDSTYRQVSKGL